MTGITESTNHQKPKPGSNRNFGLVFAGAFAFVPSGLIREPLGKHLLDLKAEPDRAGAVRAIQPPQGLFSPLFGRSPGLPECTY